MNRVYAATWKHAYGTGRGLIYGRSPRTVRNLLESQGYEVITVKLTKLVCISDARITGGAK